LGGREENLTFVGLFFEVFKSFFSAVHELFDCVPAIPVINPFTVTLRLDVFIWGNSKN